MSTTSPTMPYSDSQALRLAARTRAKALLRERARRSLHDFVISLGEHQPAPHHRMLCTCLQMVVERQMNRVMVFMPPGGAKSTYCSVYAPAWAVGRRPDVALIAGSHTTGLAKLFGRRVRNLIASVDYQGVFDTVLDPGSRAAHEWHTFQKRPGDRRSASYVAAGVGTGIAGRRADIAIIDDPFKSRKDADSPVQRDTVWNWYLGDVRARLKPNGAIIIVNCLTGDTPVLMADGSEKALRHIRPGDKVASYLEGTLVARTVLNWTNQGPDQTFEIRTRSGATVRGNERHPFLVFEDGEPRWIRLRDLRPGHEIFRVSGENGGARPAPERGAISQRNAGGTARPITTRSDGPMGSGRLPIRKKSVAQRISSIVTALLPKNIGGFWRNRAARAPCAGSLPAVTCARTGAGNSASTIATIPGGSARSYVTTAISWLGMRKPLKSRLPQPNTSDFTLDTIVSIEPAGTEDVFDIQVEGTENFIANGLVSHNTRWHEDDLCGRILPEGYNGESGWIRARDGEWWFVVSIQALAEREDDILGRAPGESYWPNYFTRPYLEQERISQLPRNWSALYQQRPSPEEGDYYKREWFQWYDELPKHCRFYGASDYAVTEDGGDWTVHVVGAVAGPAMLEDLYLVDYWTGQTDSAAWIQTFIDLVLRHRPIAWAEEHGQISKSLGPVITLEQMRQSAWTHREQFSVSGDKGQRGQSFRALTAQRRVFLPRHAPWAKDLLDRLLRFGATSRDDDHDACGLLGRLVHAMRGSKEIKQHSNVPKYGTFEYLLYVTDQQRTAERSIYRRPS